MLYIVKDTEDEFIQVLQDDPVRPHIPKEHRVGKNKDIFVLKEKDEISAITCVSYQKSIPHSEDCLFEICEQPTTAVFYTIWSYKSGKGRQLILDSVQYIREHNKSIETFVTLSPKTEIARNFHLKNGAKVLRENRDTVNYVYAIE